MDMWTTEFLWTTFTSCKLFTNCIPSSWSLAEYWLHTAVLHTRLTWPTKCLILLFTFLFVGIYGGLFEMDILISAMHATQDKKSLKLSFERTGSSFTELKAEDPSPFRNKSWRRQRKESVVWQSYEKKGKSFFVDFVNTWDAWSLDLDHISRQWYRGRRPRGRRGRRPKPKLRRRRSNKHPKLKCSSWLEVRR